MAATLYVATISSGCGRGGVDQAQLPIDVLPTLGQRVMIAPIVTHLGVTGRSVLACPAGYCVILHYPPASVPIEDLARVLKGDPGTDADDGEVYSDPDSPWCTPWATGAGRHAFNCCTFAVGDVAGLTPDDWILPTRSGDAFDTVPMEVLLDSFYKRVRVLAGPGVTWADLEQDIDLRTDDVLCFVHAMEQLTCYSHVGRIHKKRDRNWLVSKFGAGPILCTTIEATGRHFAGSYEQIWIYRPKAN